MTGSTNVDGFSFADAEDVTLADEEVKKIKFIAQKMNMDNPKGVLAVYDKLVSSGIFVTPIGVEYLRTLQSYLYKCQSIPDEAVREIPVPISYSKALGKRNEEREERLRAEREKRTLRKTFKNEYKISLILNLILFFMVIAMFVITLKAENPNMINYRTAIINQYSDWEQRLTDRENALKERELKLQSLGIDLDSLEE